MIGTASDRQSPRLATALRRRRIQPLLAARGRTLVGNSRGLILKELQARNYRKTYFHHGLLGLFVLLLGACTSCGTERNEATQPSIVRIGYLPFASDLALFLAEDKGYFQEEGIEVELVRFQAANDNLNSLLTGRIDMAGMLGFPTLFAAFEKDTSSFRAFLGTAETEKSWASAILVPPGSTATTIADLKGKTIGTYSGTTQLLNLKSILQSFMDPERDVVIRQVQQPLQISALESGQFDALFTIEPTITAAVAKGVARVLVENPRYRYILQPFPVTSCAVSTTFLNRHADETRAVYRALARAVRDIRNDPRVARTSLSSHTDLAPNLVTSVRLYDWWPPREVDYGAVQKLADLFLRQGLLSHRIEIRDMFVELDKPSR